MATLAEIRMQIESLKKQERDAMTKEREPILADIRQKIADYGISASELGFGGAGRRASAGSAPKAPKSAAKVKYRDGANTWSGGRGPKPKWVKAKIEAGQDIEKYRVG